MRAFADIYEHPDLGREAVKKGFGWPAFCFHFFTGLSCIWAWVKGMKGVGFALLAVYLAEVFLVIWMTVAVADEESPKGLLMFFFWVMTS